MKDVLEYTINELQSLDINELKLLLREAESKESLYNTIQLAEKLAINSVYGALGNKWFPLFNQEIARSITGNGRYFIKKMSNYIEEKLTSLMPIEDGYGIYNDTDSVVGDTMISTSEGEVSIENLYHSMNGQVDVLRPNNFVKHIANKITCVSYNTNTHKLENKQIKYIMAHKVKKRMFRIQHNNKSVDVTEDHSVIIFRDGKYIDVSPANIKNGDKIIRLFKNKQDTVSKLVSLIRKNMSTTQYDDNFTVEDLGVHEQWVYDIEVDDNHNFFANDILVHNSFYFTLAPFVEKSGLSDTQDIVDFCDRFYNEVIDESVQRCIEDFTKEFNVFNPGMIGAEREIIADSGVFVAKKKYFARVLDSEGVRYDEPKTKVMGLEIIKSSTPTFTKKMLKKSIDIILDKDKADLSYWLEKTKQLYTEEPLGDIASIGGVSNLDYSLSDKGVPIGARSAIVHNNYIQENNLENTYALIQGGDKTKRLYLIEPNPLNSNIVAFLDDRFIEEFKDYIDYDTNFEKGFMAPLQLMTNALNWNMSHTIDELDAW